MIPLINITTCKLFHGDAKDIAAELPPDSIDALVTDPPAGIGFMGKGWDGDKGGRDEWVAWLEGIMRGALTVLKPGAYALVWALPRTSHWTATALENAGFEVRDVVMHLFGTGFPKSLDVAKAGAGADWDGWGTALKPAAEHWILARKPLVGTVAANVLRYGTGGLNIDGCRIPIDPKDREVMDNRSGAGFGTGITVGAHQGRAAGKFKSHAEGRFPANVLLSHLPECSEACAPGCAVAALDAQSGILHARGNKTAKVQKIAESPTGFLAGKTRTETGNPGDSGGASRFFYCAKPGRSERDLGCEALPIRSGGEATDREEGSAGLSSPRAGAGRTGGARNFHPTVKAQALMRYLCRLITPPGGVVLDLFAGSGSTGVAAIAEGFSFVGVEQSEEYIPIAKARLENALESSILDLVS